LLVKIQIVVLDNTMGSGSTGIACKNTNRSFIGIELEKKYFDLASERINPTSIPLSVSNAAVSEENV